MKWFNLFILAGNDPRHRTWLANLKRAAEPKFGMIVTQSYQHWETDSEMATAKELTKSLSPYIIIAQSIGTLIALRSVNEGILKPKALVLVGLPWKTYRSQLLELLKSPGVPHTIIQNSHDPLGSYGEVRADLASQHLWPQTIEAFGEAHEYTDFPDIIFETELYTGSDARIHPTASVDPSVRLGKWVSIGRDCQIGAGTTIMSGDTINDGVTIGKNVKIGKDVVLLPGGVVEDDAKVLEGATIASNTSVKRGATVGRWCFIGERVIVGKNSTVKPGVFIENDTAIPDSVRIRDVRLR